MSGYPPGQVVSNWGDYIEEPYRHEVAIFWQEVYTSGLPEQIGEWQFTNGRWGECKNRLPLTLCSNSVGIVCS